MNRFMNKFIKKYMAVILTLIISASCISGCSKRPQPDEENPVTLTIWHVYGSQTDSPLNNAIDEFNRTIGKEKGITINVVSVTSSSAIDKALLASASGEPGAEDMPDLFTAYPRVAEIVGKENLLSWNDYFTKQELSEFTDTFLSEGYFEDKLLMLPIAKSSEALFLNKTLFDRFATETGVTVEDLTTFDSLFEVIRKYYDWSDGKNFLQFNDYYNYAYVGMKSYDSEFVKDGKLQLDTEAFERIWTPLARTAIYGGICLEDGYAAARWKTVEIIANTGSTADVLYQPDEVIYADNTTESITSLALPYPVFTEDKPGVVHRGGGLFAIKSTDERKNYAAYTFAKWLTDSQHNLSFVTETGYLPVTDHGFDTLFSDLSIVKNKNYHSLYEAVDTMIQTYSFYPQPLYGGASETQLQFEQNVKAVLGAAHNQYIQRTTNGENADAVLNELTENSLIEIQNLTVK